MATQVLVLKDARGTPLWAINFTDSENIIYIPADTEKTLTVPAGCNLAVFAYSDPSCYVGTESFSLPSTTFSSAEQVKLAPSALNVAAGSTLYFRARAQIEVGVTFGAGGDD